VDNFLDVRFLFGYNIFKNKKTQKTLNKNMNLTKKQKEVLDYIIEFEKDNGYTPSYQEIANDLGLSSKATVAEHVKNLENKGYLKTNYNEARSIQLVEQEKKSEVGVLPLLGLIAAGEPIEAIEGTDKITVPADLAQSSYYALQVKGDSMIEDGILEGDYIIADKAQQPNNGDIVVALLENENATLKRFYKEKDRIKLQPANSSLKPFYVKDIQVQGVVRGLIRKY
jgi:repressor LexA